MNTVKIKYISDEVFEKMTKKQKAEIPSASMFDEIEIDRLVIVPTNRKMSGYFVGDFFAHTPEKGWWRPMTYDCWRVTTDIENPITPKYTLLKGDFENGGVQIFGFVDEFCKAFMSYGGEIKIKKR